ncbi:MAG: HI0074 family nucleotidyltransferase substrate-binding subunit [Treponema sp.]|jgi:nucleotidyltransferase substrate binding protein (TIGR01987 family)|nr:HI0074 family nucleotidyltransferase substrate-binding subunit [Treponema sp.]
MELITESFEKALTTLKEAWMEYQKDVSNTFIRDSVIQRFEYTFELSHKLLRRFLSETESSRIEISEMLFNDLIRLGCKRGLLLNDLEVWDKYRRSRNLTSHNYDEFNAENIAVIIPVFIEDMDYELAKIKEKSNQQTVLLHIDENHLKIITSTIKSIPELNDCSVYLYGSRVQGKPVKYSDVDIALDYNGKPIPDALKVNLSSLFENSILPYTVDVIDINSISPVFRAKIEKDFVRLM